MGKSKAWAIRKVEIAIDKMIDLQDEGLGNENIARILEHLNELQRQLKG